MSHRCENSIERNGELLRCEDVEGHMSAHYCGSEWWPNEHGLPEQQHHFGWWQWLVVALLGACLGIATYWFLVR